jgi:hypothetical protein
MKSIFILLIAAGITGCATNNNNNNWHWEKPGSSSNEFNMDNGQCRAQGFAGTGGMLTWGTIMIVDSCMQGKGWYKVNDR